MGIEPKMWMHSCKQPIPLDCLDCRQFCHDVHIRNCVKSLNEKSEATETL